MRWLLAVFLFLLPSVAFSQNLTDEDIEAITNSITLRAMQIQESENDDDIHQQMDGKLNQILENQAAFQALVREYITQELRKTALREVIREQRFAAALLANRSASNVSTCGSRGRFSFFGRGRF